MRLIDADALPKILVFKASEETRQAIEMITNMIQKAPTIDAEPVIKCKDCSWVCKRDEYGRLLCDYYNGFRFDDEYCSKAERKKDETY